MGTHQGCTRYIFSVNTMDVLQKNDALLQTIRDKNMDFDSFKRELYETCTPTLTSEFF